jgi:malonyl-CoA O-methyltransferase
MHHTNEFSKRATSYNEHNIIQKKVVKKLIEGINSTPKSILDLGCGSGAIYKNIPWDVSEFVAVDKAINMCKLHPKDRHVKIICEDFEIFSLDSYDMIVSSSSLQWAKDLDRLLEKVSKHTEEIAFAIFCDKTFQAIYDMTKLKPFLPNSSKLLKLLNHYFDYTYEKVTYKLEFKNNIEMFRYIKKSGVSGGEKKLGFIDTKKLIKNYPYNYLEFEVLFIWGKSLR